MNDLIRNISNISIENTKKTHELLDEVMVIVASAFPGVEIKFNQNTTAFEFSTDGVDISVIRDLNRFVVSVRVSEGSSVVSDCTMDIAGGFEERYAKISNKETKLKLASIFSNISEIDVNAINERVAAADKEAESEPTIPDEPENETPAAPEVEVVSEG